MALTLTARLSMSLPLLAGVALSVAAPNAGTVSLQGSLARTDADQLDRFWSRSVGSGRLINGVRLTRVILVAVQLSPVVASFSLIIFNSLSAICQRPTGKVNGRFEGAAGVDALLGSISGVKILLLSSKCECTTPR
jgi:hypothetical protein